jgi:transposase InsO family protein
MLSEEQKAVIPRTTKQRWDDILHEDYFGYEMVKDYIADFDHIKEVLTNKHIKQGIRFMCALSSGYRDVVSKIEGNKKLLRGNAENITYSIQRFAKYGNLKLNDACRIFGVNRDWFYRHRKKKMCAKSILGRCFKQQSNQLTLEEVAMIESIVSDPDNRGKRKTTLFFGAMRKGLIACGISTFFKYADLVGYQKPKKTETEKRAKGFRATRPFEWLHVDVTHVQTQNDGVQYVAFIKDNFSKALLGYKSISHRPNSNFIRDLFEETFIKYHLLDASDQINILSDGGSENKGSLIEWINQISAPPVVRKLTAKTDEFPFSNSMAESTHSIYKSEFLQKKLSLNIEQHFEHLDQFMEYHDHQRYPFEHFGLTPYEVLGGEIPNKFQFREQIGNRQKERLEENRSFNGCPVLCIQ